MQTINLDISVKSIIPLLHAKQADVGRKFKVVLSDGGKAYPLPGGAAVSIWYSGASGEGNYTEVGVNSAVSVSGNEIVVEMIAQMLANYGAGTMCIVIHTADGKQLGTWNIPYMVEPLPGMGSEAAKAYFTAFSKAVENLPYPDASLSVPGKAADAASVGAALAGKAPAGYGLGGSAKMLTSADNLDNITENGWYAWSDIPQGFSYGGCIMHVYNMDKNWLVQEITNLVASPGSKIIRQRLDGVWQPVEWVNPPMTPGVEYRTTERWNGKVVYVKAVNAGVLTNGAYVNFTEANLYGGIRACATVEGYVAPFYSGGALVFAASAEPSAEGVRVAFYSNGWFDGKNVTVCLWYTKD